MVVFLYNYFVTYILKCNQIKAGLHVERSQLALNEAKILLPCVEFSPDMCCSFYVLKSKIIDLMYKRWLWQIFVKKHSHYLKSYIFISDHLTTFLMKWKLRKHVTYLFLLSVPSRDWGIQLWSFLSFFSSSENAN